MPKKDKEKAFGKERERQRGRQGDARDDARLRALRTLMERKEAASGPGSAAALETLAVIAYKQPVSRNQIASIRGVNVDAVMRTLQQRGYVDEVARDPGPGQAVLYGTTPTFLERLGIDSVEDLPPLGEFFPEADVVEALERGLRVGSDDDELDGAHAESTDADHGGEDE